ncbi:DUF5069 domain-containing protein [Candidatus Poribacteria bacterium]|nr:DUF5069 domain-containing protein [Candidatus Poribacteria bacterium]MYG08215.1 DUF5069 domain-containing protein [Candidatus Poribacteria bacterium]MYK21782.1 DUF5069 domain-containing protein [Candidatus Poribacteria bacterium]
MDLTRQPPRRPSNLGVAGIVGAARMTDKARAYNDETLGEYIYGESSGLDQRVLVCLGISADAFAEAAGERDDTALGHWVLETSGKTAAEIAEFNDAALSQLPDTDAHKQRLKDRLARYAPGRTDITTVLQSMELDDWGSFWQVDLTAGPPRSARAKDIAGVCGVARMADKARAARAEKIGEYLYGDDSGQDVRILTFLGISAADFQEAAVNNPNDLEIGAWVRENCDKSDDEIETFNETLINYAPNEASQERFNARRQEIDPTRTDINTWVALQDLDDQLSFGIIDLNRRAPRSPYSTDVYGMVQLPRLIDKGRASNSNTLGAYFYGEDSGIDRATLTFLGVSATEFAEKLETLSTDAEVEAWLKADHPKSDTDIEAYNERMTQMGPTDERYKALMASMINRIAPERTDINTWFALMLLDDEKTFAS